MKEFEEKAIRELIQFYTAYISGKNPAILKRKAIEIEGKYLNASALVSDVVFQAIGKLVYFYAKGIPHGEPPSKENAKKIIEELKKQKKELKKIAKQRRKHC